MRSPEYYIVAASALPEVFRKTAEVNRMLQTGEARTVNDAVRIIGVSRNAYYKYKDSIMPFNNMTNDRIITLQMVLLDEPGILSAILSIFAERGANILTINQSVPVNGCAAVNLSVECSGITQPLDELINAVRGMKGVLRLEILEG